MGFFRASNGLAAADPAALARGSARKASDLPAGGWEENALQMEDKPREKCNLAGVAGVAGVVRFFFQTAF